MYELGSREVAEKITRLCVLELVLCDHFGGPKSHQRGDLIVKIGPIADNRHCLDSLDRSNLNHCSPDARVSAVLNHAITRTEFNKIPQHSVRRAWIDGDCRGCLDWYVSRNLGRWCSSD